MSTEIFIVSGARTAIGTFGGSLKDQTPTGLGTNGVKEAIRRAKLEPRDVDHSVFGNYGDYGITDYGGITVGLR